MLSVPPLFLLHGFTGSPASWDGVLALLPERRTLRPALLGHGAPPPEATTFAGEIARLAALLPDEPVHLAGYSLGARMALSLALAHPERIGYFQQTPQRWPTLQRKFQQLRESGVLLLIGTDSGIPMKFHSGSTWNELDVWVNKLGVPTIDAIRAATYWPAVAMKADKDYGTVTEGKYADIIAVKGDVLKQVALLQRVDIVVKHGRRIK